MAASAPHDDPGSSLAASMAANAEAFLRALRPEQSAIARYPFASPERERWFYTPTAQAGLPLAEMDAPQQRAALRLVASGLAFSGYVTVATIMGLENVLDAQEGWRGSYLGRDERSRGRDPALYFLAIFGAPDARHWGWRFGGHHVSLNYTLVDGRVVSPTPLFFGAHPAEVPLGAAQTLRPLGAEEDLGRDLLLALDERERETAILAPVAPYDIVQGNRPRIAAGALPFHLPELFALPVPVVRAERQLAAEQRYRETWGLSDAHLEAVRYTATPKGIAAGNLHGHARELFVRLLRQYIARLPDPLAAEAEGRYLGAPEIFGALRFAWAGSAKRGEPHYYRIQGPRLLIEYDNAQDNANHVHTVWRDPEGDFGFDILAAHYAQAHAPRA